jgi:hypothetical protein
VRAFLLAVAMAGFSPRSAGAMAKPLRRPWLSREILLSQLTAFVDARKDRTAKSGFGFDFH